MRSDRILGFALALALSGHVPPLYGARPIGARASGRTTSSEAQTHTLRTDSLALPPFVQVVEHGGIARAGFPVSGSIPMPQGVLRPDELATLGLRDAMGQRVAVQFDVTGRWTDGSVKWLRLDFPTRQPAGRTARYHFSRGDPAPQPDALSQISDDGIVVNTGPLRVIFRKTGMGISVRSAEGRWASVSQHGFISRIGVRQRDQSRSTQYLLDAHNHAELEHSGPQRAVIRVKGWHRSDGGDQYSPSVIRLTFYRGLPFIRVHHTFVISKNPDSHVITDIALELPLDHAIRSAAFLAGDTSKVLDVSSHRLAVSQENLHQPSYPGFYYDCEFRGRYRIFDGSEVVATGRRYRGGLTLTDDRHGIGVYLSDFWQLSPKALTYDPATKTVRVGLFPGEFAHDLDLMRTEIKNPVHYQRYRERERDQWGQYSPTYVPHDLVHSAMGMSRTHEMVFWFGARESTPDPEAMRRLFEQPLVPFVSGQWNVKTGVMGKHAAPAEYDQRLNDVTGRMVDELHRTVEAGGWYGLLKYGNFRYAWDKTNTRWMKYNPKYAWFHAGHLMEGGTLTQVLWYQYLRHGDVRDYVLARARSRQVLDLSVVHYHDQPEYVGAMLRHGGPDPWVGHRKRHGAHFPVAGLPTYYYVTGDPRAADVLQVLARTNYRYRDLNHGRDMDTDLANMMLFYELTGDRKYYQRAVEYVNYYYETRKDAADELTYFNYRTTALHWFYRACEDAELREKAKAVFLDSYAAFWDQRGHPGNPEMAAFAYELRRDATSAQWVDESLRRFVRQGSGQIGWYDNMLLVSPNETGLLNAAAYARYWQRRVHADEVAPVTLSPDGGTFRAAPSVVMSCDTPGATIRYTLDGSEPGPESTVYDGPVLIRGSCQLRARGFRDGLRPTSSAVADFAVESLPFDTVGLQAWFRCGRGIQQRGSRAVRWADQSGHGRHAVAGRNWARHAARDHSTFGDTRESAPEIIPDALHGFPVIRGGIGHYLELERFVPLTGDATLIWVCLAPPGDTGPLIGDGDDGHVAIHDVPPGRLSVRWNVGVPGVQAAMKDAIAPGCFVVGSTIRQGDDVALYANGMMLGSHRLPRITPMNLRVLFAMRPWQSFCRTCIAELLVFDRAVDPRQRHTIEDYLGRTLGPFPARSPVSDQFVRQGRLSEEEESADTSRETPEEGELAKPGEEETPSGAEEESDHVPPVRGENGDK